MQITLSKRKQTNKPVLCERKYPSVQTNTSMKNLKIWPPGRKQNQQAFVRSSSTRDKTQAAWSQLTNNNKKYHRGTCLGNLVERMKKYKHGRKATDKKTRRTRCRYKALDGLSTAFTTGTTIFMKEMWAKKIQYCDVSFCLGFLPCTLSFSTEHKKCHIIIIRL